MISVMGYYTICATTLNVKSNVLVFENRSFLFQVLTTSNNRIWRLILKGMTLARKEERRRQPWRKVIRVAICKRLVQD